MERIVQLDSIDTVIAVFGQFDKNVNMIVILKSAVKTTTSSLPKTPSESSQILSPQVKNLQTRMCSTP